MVVCNFEKFGLLPGLCDQHCVITFATCSRSMHMIVLTKLMALTCEGQPVGGFKVACLVTDAITSSLVNLSCPCVNTSHITTPNDHTSVAMVNLPYMMDSGAIHQMGNTVYLCTLVKKYHNFITLESANI